MFFSQIDNILFIILYIKKKRQTKYHSPNFIFKREQECGHDLVNPHKFRPKFLGLYHGFVNPYKFRPSKLWFLFIKVSIFQKFITTLYKKKL